jgi:hypothetical protein
VQGQLVEGQGLIPAARFLGRHDLILQPRAVPADAHQACQPVWLFQLSVDLLDHTLGVGNCHTTGIILVVSILWGINPFLFFVFCLYSLFNFIPYIIPFGNSEDSHKKRSATSTKYYFFIFFSPTFFFL